MQPFRTNNKSKKVPLVLSDQADKAEKTRLVFYFVIFLVLLFGGILRGQASSAPHPLHNMRINVVGALDFLAHGNPLLLFKPHAMPYGKLGELWNVPDDKLLDSTYLNETLAQTWSSVQNPGNERVILGGTDAGQVFLYLFGFLIFGLRIESLYFSFVLFFLITIALIEFDFRSRLKSIPHTYKAGSVILAIATSFSSLSASDFGNQSFSPINTRVVSILCLIPLYHLMLDCKYSTLRTTVSRRILKIQIFLLLVIIWSRSNVQQYLALAILLSLFALALSRFHKNQLFLKNILVKSFSVLLLVWTPWFIVGLVSEPAPRHPVFYNVIMGAALNGTDPQRDFLEVPREGCSQPDVCTVNAIIAVTKVPYVDSASYLEKNAFLAYSRLLQAHPVDTVFVLPARQFELFMENLKAYPTKIHLLWDQVVLLVLLAISLLIEINRSLKRVQFGNQTFVTVPFLTCGLLLMGSFVGPTFIFSSDYHLFESYALIVATLYYAIFFSVVQANNILARYFTKRI